MLVWIAIAHWLTACFVLRSDSHAAPNRWTAAYLALVGFLEANLALNSRGLVHVALALLPALMIELAMTLYHLSASQRRASHAASFLLCTGAIAASWSLSYDSRGSAAILLAWLAIGVLVSIVLWVPVLKSPVRKQKHDETTRNTFVWLIAPMIPLYVSLILGQYEYGEAPLSYICWLLTGLSIIGFILYRFVMPARRSWKLDRTRS